MENVITALAIACLVLIPAIVEFRARNSGQYEQLPGDRTRRKRQSRPKPTPTAQTVDLRSDFRRVNEFRLLALLNGDLHRMRRLVKRMKRRYPSRPVEWIWASLIRGLNRRRI